MPKQVEFGTQHPASITSRVISLGHGHASCTGAVDAQPAGRKRKSPSNSSGAPAGFLADRCDDRAPGAQFRPGGAAACLLPLPSQLQLLGQQSDGARATPHAFGQLDGVGLASRTADGASTGGL